MKGMDFLKGIHQIDEKLIEEAAVPEKRIGRNVNIFKFAGLAAAVAVFVGMICAGHNQSVTKATTEAVSEEQATTQQDIYEKVEVEVTIRKMAMINGELYVDSRQESDITQRSCVMDGEITSTTEEEMIPSEDNQSNFGIGYRYQYVADKSIDIYIDGIWERFVLLEGAIPYDMDTDIEETTELAGDGIQEKETAVLVLEEGTLTADGASFSILNGTPEEMFSGEAYRIEWLNHDSWEECALQQELVFPEIGWDIPAGGEWKFQVDWSAFYGTLQKGTYRLLKEVSTNEGVLVLTCEFEI